jgi:surface polysaccharide O-acyltransferase-like enzyme
MREYVPRPGTRRTDLDLLRVIACFSIILAHAVLIFTSEPRYHIKSAEALIVADWVYEALRIGTLPLFFALAGWGAVATLRRRSPGTFLRDRVVRVLFPLVSGILLIGPFIKYIERLHGRNLGFGGFRLVEPLQASIPTFLSQYWGRFNLLTWSHLWFLGYLFILSVALLPLLVYLARRTPSTHMPGRGLAFAPAPALALLVVASGGYWPNLPNLLQDWGSLAFYGGCVALGGWLAASPGLESRFRRDAPLFLALALLGYILMMWAGHTNLGRAAAGLCAWGAIGASFGFAGRRPPEMTPALAWLGESTMAVYVLHHLPVLVIGAWLLPLAFPDSVKMVAIVVGATLVTLVTYRFIVLPFTVPRVLIGMDARPKTSRPSPPAN